MQECREPLKVGGGLGVTGGKCQGLVIMLPRLLQLTVEVQNGAEITMAGHVLGERRTGTRRVSLVQCL